MSNVLSKFDCDILHVRPEPSDDGRVLPYVAELESTLGSVPVKTETYPDVYRALAALCTCQSDELQAKPRLRAVIVCVDDIGAAELEFFTHLARARPALRVYVYGHERFEPRMKDAEKLGAAGRATEDLIRSIAEEVQQPLSEQSEPAVEPKPTQPVETADLGDVNEVASKPEIEPPAPMDESAHVAGGDGESAPTPEPAHQSGEAEQESVADPVRVPWLRHGDRPTRQAPKRAAPTAHTRPSTELETPPLSETSADEPLLTEAEMQALLGDDIAAIAPQEQSTPDSVQSDGGEGVS